MPHKKGYEYEWYQMPTFEKCARLLSRLLGRIRILSLITLRFVWVQKRRFIVYTAVFLLFWQVYLPIFQRPSNINQAYGWADTQFYTCELNEFTHRIDEECSMCYKACGKYDFCECTDFWQVLEYEYCAADENCRFTMIGVQRKINGEWQTDIDAKPIMERKPSPETVLGNDKKFTEDGDYNIDLYTSPMINQWEINGAISVPTITDAIFIPPVGIDEEEIANPLSVTVENQLLKMVNQGWTLLRNQALLRE